MRLPFERALDRAAENNRYIVSLGDIVDYGPESKAIVEKTHDLVKSGRMSVVLGNHEFKLSKYFKQKREGKVRVKVKSSLQASIDSFADDEAAIDKFMDLHNDMINVIRFKDTYFAHAALHPDLLQKEEYFPDAFSYSLFGQVDKVKPMREDGFPNRIYNWTPLIPKHVRVMVGHDIRSAELPYEDGSVIFLDTGCGKHGILHGAELSKDGNFERYINFGK